MHFCPDNKKTKQKKQQNDSILNEIVMDNLLINMKIQKWHFK